MGDSCDAVSKTLLQLYKYLWISPEIFGSNELVLTRANTNQN